MSTESITESTIVKSTIATSNIVDTTTEATELPVTVLGALGDHHATVKDVHQEDLLHTKNPELRKTTEEVEYIDVADDNDAGKTSPTSTSSTDEHRENSSTSSTSAPATSSSTTQDKIHIDSEYEDVGHSFTTTTNRDVPSYPSATTSFHVVTTKVLQSTRSSTTASSTVSQRQQYQSTTHPQPTLSTSTEDSKVGGPVLPLHLPHTESLTADGRVKMRWNYDDENIIIQVCILL